MQMLVFVWIYSYSGSSFCDNLSRHICMTLWCVCACVCECVRARLRMCVCVCTWLCMCAYVFYCSVLQCVAVATRPYQSSAYLAGQHHHRFVAVRCSVLQSVAMCCSRRAPLPELCIPGRATSSSGGSNGQFLR